MVFLDLQIHQSILYVKKAAKHPLAAFDREQITVAD